MFRSIQSDRKMIMIDEMGEMVFSWNIKKEKWYDFLMIVNHLLNAFKGKDYINAVSFFFNKGKVAGATPLFVEE
ncbi:hypothetical protein FHQ18_06825 [Deferribacter autotrophicus]|uniref:Uncharacterized protein n=1 Tax=Deferribacter autotrophicus TaxID=500465 RepID=A0A5A8F4X0_9BACT|nr:hypothetical protein [Deferribacter autotrophicus]KAA0258105.1 hypothetical protein FHQ18_06825 [Deferribacter autotrophicus]